MLNTVLASNALPAAAAVAVFGKGKKHGTDYGNGVYSRKGNLTINGEPYTSLSYLDAQKYYEYMRNWTDKHGNSTSGSRAEAAKLKQVMDEKYPAYMQEMYQLRMQEYMGAMAEAMAKEEPASEPLKAAAEAQDNARNDVARKQLLRRGLMSTMTRYGKQGGQGTKLGA